MKKPWTSWKDYAKGLELKIRDLGARERYTQACDFLLKETLQFPSEEKMKSYLRKKAELNHKLAVFVVGTGDEASPKNISHREMLLMQECALVRKELQAHIEEYGIRTIKEQR